MRQSHKSAPSIGQVSKQCCGCLACVASCRVGAIQVTRDNLGFMRPEMDAALCVSCGACDKVCPVLNDIAMDRTSECYWCQSKIADQLAGSSSGGVFGLLATRVLEDGGVVYAAAFSDDFSIVVHSRIDRVDNLYQALTSKYVQSYISPALYSMLLADLQNEKTVLFSGTTCQVEAVKLYLQGKKYNGRILSIDVMCHGAPSPLLWSSYVGYLEERGKERLYSVNFRSKLTGWTTFSFRYEYRNGKVIEERHNMNWYMKAFLNNASLRQSCFDCPSKRACGSDITLGDYWGFDSDGEEVDVAKGVSAVIIHSALGNLYFNEILEDMVLGKASFEDISANNPALEHSVRPFEKRDQFIDDILSGMELNRLMRKWTFRRGVFERILGKMKCLLAREGEKH